MKEKMKQLVTKALMLLLAFTVVGGLSPYPILAAPNVYTLTVMDEDKEGIEGAMIEATGTVSNKTSDLAINEKGSGVYELELPSNISTRRKCILRYSIEADGYYSFSDSETLSTTTGSKNIYLNKLPSVSIDASILDYADVFLGESQFTGDDLEIWFNPDDAEVPVLAIQADSSSYIKSLFVNDEEQDLESRLYFECLPASDGQTRINADFGSRVQTGVLDAGEESKEIFKIQVDGNEVDDPSQFSVYDDTQEITIEPTEKYILTNVKAADKNILISDEGKATIIIDNQTFSLMDLRDSLIEVSYSRIFRISVQFEEDKGQVIYGDDVAWIESALLPEGEELQLTITPYEGYRLYSFEDQMLEDGVIYRESVDEVNKFNSDNPFVYLIDSGKLNADHEFVIEFLPRLNKVTVDVQKEAISNLKITQRDDTSEAMPVDGYVNNGADGEISFDLNPGYILKSVTLEGDEDYSFTPTSLESSKFSVYIADVYTDINLKIDTDNTPVSVQDGETKRPANFSDLIEEDTLLSIADLEEYESAGIYPSKMDGLKLHGRYLVNDTDLLNYDEENDLSTFSKTTEVQSLYKLETGVAENGQPDGIYWRRVQLPENGIKVTVDQNNPLPILEISCEDGNAVNLEDQIGDILVCQGGTLKISLDYSDPGEDASGIAEATLFAVREEEPGKAEEREVIWTANEDGKDEAELNLDTGYFGTYRLTLSCVDKAGHNSENSVFFENIQDQIDEIVKLDVSSTKSIFGKSDNPEINVILNDRYHLYGASNYKAELYYQEDTEANAKELKMPAPDESLQIDDNGTAAVSYSYNLEGFKDGIYTFKIEYSNPVLQQKKVVKTKDVSFVIDSTKPTARIELKKAFGTGTKTFVSLVSESELLKPVGFGNFANTSEIMLSQTVTDLTKTTEQYYIERFDASEQSNIQFKTDDELAAMDPVVWKDSWIEAAETVSGIQNGNFVAYFKIEDEAHNIAYFRTDGFTIDMINPDIHVDIVGYESKNGQSLPYIQTEPEQGSEISIIYTGTQNTPAQYPLKFLVEYSKENSGYQEAGFDYIDYELLQNGKTIKSGRWNDEDFKSGNLEVDLFTSGKNRKYYIGDLELIVTGADQAGNTGQAVRKLTITDHTPQISIEKSEEDHFNTRAVKDEQVDFSDDARHFSVTISDLKTSFKSNEDIETSLLKVWSGKEDESEIGAISIKNVSGDNSGATGSTVISKVYDVSFDLTEDEIDRKFEWTFENTAEACTNKANITPSLPKGKENDLERFVIDKEGPTDLQIILNKNEDVEGSTEVKWNNVLKKGEDLELSYSTFYNYSRTAAFKASDNSGYFDASYAVLKFSDTDHECSFETIENAEYKPLADLDEAVDGIISEGENQKYILVLKAVDYAGNESYSVSSGIVYDTKASLPEIEAINPVATKLPGQDHPEVSAVYIFNNDLPVDDKNETITLKGSIDDGELYSGIYEAKLVTPDRDTPLWSWKKNSSETELIKKQSINNETGITLNKEEYNRSDVHLQLITTDNAGNSATKEIQLDVDMDAPEVSMSVNGESKAEALADNYSEATVKFVFTERDEHFDPDKAREAIKIKAVDYAGNSIVSTPEYSEWTTNETGMEHTIELTFKTDANYTVTVEGFSDTSGNLMVPAEEVSFTVDNLNPTGSITASTTNGVSNSWSELIDDLRFAFWANEEIHLETEQSDEVSGIQSVKAYKAKSERPNAATTALTWEELDRIRDWSEVGGIQIHPDEQCTVYLRILDNAGNYTFISTDGLITDNTNPDIENVDPEVTISPEQPHNGFYNDDVTVDVKVEDPVNGGTYSGLKSITYEVYNLSNSSTEPTQSGELFGFTDINPKQSDLQQNWSGSLTVDSELNNSNDVVIRVYAEDNSGNVTEKEATIQIDITAPEISVSYDNNSADSEKYFKSNRTATIIVTERNFDPKLVTADITSSDTEAPSIGDWIESAGTGNMDNTTWTATIEYTADSDYTFNIACTDKAGWNNKTVEYASGTVAANEFTIDKTVPTIEVTYDNNSSKNDNYYNADRTATISVNEHNFTDSRITISLKAEDNGKTIDTPTPGSWSHQSGDIYQCTINYNYDGYFTFDIQVTDLAGNDAADFTEQKFYIDKTKPELKLENVEDHKSYKDDVQPVLTYSDTNIDHSATAIKMRGAETKEIKVEDWGSYSDIENGKVFTFKNFPKEEKYDDVYHLEALVTDKAGNSSDPIDVLFSANRYGSTYMLSAETEKINNTYSQTPVDIKVTEINPSKLSNVSATVYKNEKTILLDEPEMYSIESSGGDDEWFQNVYTVKADNFRDDGVYRVVLHSEDEAGNIAENSLISKDKEINFGIDATAPTLVVNNLESGITYPVDALEVFMYPMDNLLLSKVAVYLDDNMQPEVSWNQEQVTDIISNTGEFSFTIPGDSTQAHTLRVVCTDAAGNEFETEFDDFYVTTNLWVRFFNNKPLFYGTIACLVALVAFLIYFFGYRKKTSEEEQEAQA